MILDSKLDISSLVEKGVVLLTKKAYIASSLLTTAVALFEDSTEIIEVPDDCAYINDDVKLNQQILLKYGSRLFIHGDMSIKEDGFEELKKIEVLYVTGNLETYEEYVQQLNQAKHFEKELVLCSSNVRYIEDKAKMILSKSFIEKSVQNTLIRDCGVVEIEKDIPVELLEEKVQFEDCGIINCSKDQEKVVQLIAYDCGKICTSKDVNEEEKQDCETILVNTSSYVF